MDTTGNIVSKSCIDRSGNVVKQLAGNTFSDYTYDKSSNQIVKCADDNTPIRTYSYDEFDRISTVKDELTDIMCTYAYDDHSRVISMIYTDDTDILESFGYVYDEQDNIIERSHVNNLPEEDKKIDELRQYVYDDHGNLTQSIKTDRLKENTQSVTSYTYDSVGNRASMTVDGETVTYEYNGLNQLLQIEQDDEVLTSYQYDERGNQISETNQDVTTDMEYAVTGEMTKLTKSTENDETETVTFTQENVYDENGIRISRTQDGSTRSYYYDRGVVTYTTDGEDLSSANVLDAEGDIIGTYRDEVYYGYLKDVQASTSNIVESDGTLSASYDYSDFGETTELIDSTFDNQICYTGGIYDAETELYYLNARYYDPEIGRFISQDTYRGELDDPVQWHLYAYCANNPINYVDPSEHWTAIYTRSQCKGTYYLMKDAKWKAKAIDFLTLKKNMKSIFKKFKKREYDKLSYELTKYSTTYELEKLYDFLMEGFRKGAFEYIKVTKIQKNRKKGNKKVTVKEAVSRTKLNISRGIMRFYYRSYSSEYMML